MQLCLLQFGKNTQKYSLECVRSRVGRLFSLCICTLFEVSLGTSKANFFFFKTNESYPLKGSYFRQKKVKIWTIKRVAIIGF